MELVDFIEKFVEQFDDVDVEQLNSATKFRELDDLYVAGCSIDYYND